jgi:hypothetical protein
VLGRYVREKKALSWEEAVRKMTLLPATTIGLIDRGAIAPGLAADITVFDPATIIDRATYDEPSRASEGIRHVIVNGGIVLRDGAPTGAKSGRVLQRKPSMPSRPMTPSTASRALRASGPVAAPGGEIWHVTVDVEQDRRRTFARGSIVIRDQQRRSIAEIDDLGLLQVMNGWATIAASGRAAATGAPHAFVIVVEQADPWRIDRASSIRVYSRGPSGVVEATGRAVRARVSS